MKNLSIYSEGSLYPVFEYNGEYNEGRGSLHAKYEHYYLKIIQILANVLKIFLKNHHFYLQAIVKLFMLPILISNNTLPLKDLHFDPPQVFSG